MTLQFDDVTVKTINWSVSQFKMIGMPLNVVHTEVQKNYKENLTGFIAIPLK